MTTIFPHSNILNIPIDHVGFGVNDLHACIELFKDLGFMPTPAIELMGSDPETGTVQPLGQSSAHIMFEKGYIELSSPNTQDNHLVSLIEKHQGLHILALATDNIAQQHAVSKGNISHLNPIQAASRDIGYGKEHGQAHFKWFPLPHEDFPEGIVCFVEHQSRQLVFQEAVLQHQNTSFALTGVTLCGKNPQALHDRYTQFARQQAVIPHVDEGSFLRIVSESELKSSLTDLPPPAGDAVVGLDIAVADMSGLIEMLQTNYSNFKRLENDTVLVELPLYSSFILFYAAS